MHYIYCYTNLINGKKHIGQTTNINRRKSEHLSSANNSNHKDYNALFHIKLRQYGIENFNFEILEEIDSNDLDYIDAREIYWIQEKNTYVKNEKGYNLTLGGQYGARRKPSLSFDDVHKIQELLINSNIQQYKIAELFNTNNTTVCEINTGKQYYNKELNYPLRKNFINDDIKRQIKQAILEQKLKRQEIADKFEVSLSTVKRIKASLKS